MNNDNLPDDVTDKMIDDGADYKALHETLTEVLSIRAEQQNVEGFLGAAREGGKYIDVIPKGPIEPGLPLTGTRPVVPAWDQVKLMLSIGDLRHAVGLVLWIEEG